MTESLLDIAMTKAAFAFGMMAAISVLAAVMIRGIVILLAAQSKKRVAPTPVVVSVTPARDDSAEIAAAIGAAVFAVLGAHRLVYIGEARQGAGWTSEIRTRLHTSHTPRLGNR
jgi:hypothetical protein